MPLYNILIANNLQKHQNRLIFSLFTNIHPHFCKDISKSSPRHSTSLTPQPPLLQRGGVLETIC